MTSRSAFFPALLLAAVGFLPSGASAQTAAGARGATGRTFFTPPRSGTPGRSPDLWGVPRFGSPWGPGNTTGDRVPVNVRTLADGTANQPVRHERPPRRRRPRYGRSLVEWIQVDRTVEINGPVTVNVNPPAAEASGAPPEARSRPERSRTHTGNPTPAADPADGSNRGPMADSAATANVDGPGRAVPWRPIVPHPSAASRETLPADACAVVRVSTPMGIEWRQRIDLRTLQAATPEEAARILQARIRRKEPLVLEGPAGDLTVPGALVDALVVGPCT